MKYDFDKEINRRGSHCVKWDAAKDDDVLPMWVADMDFEAAPAIKEALRRRVEHGVFGYAQVPESYYEAVTGWFGRRHQWQIERDWILYTIGVVPAVSCAIKAMTMPGDRVLVQTPVYNCFFSSIRNNGCEIAENVLVRDEDTYRIEFDDFERQCADSRTTVFLLCNPHNPAGRVWRKDELERMNEICLRHGVRVISDEIHCELVMPGYRFTPFAAVSEACLNNSVTLNSPSKSFNTAGLQIANVICKDPELRRRIDRAININEVCDVNPFAPLAVEAAYNESEDWIDELNDYICGNYQALRTFFAEQLSEAKVTKMEGTYLAWVDVSAWGITSDEVCSLLLKEGKVMVNSGTMYGRNAGEGFIRINMACPRSRLMDGLGRIGRVLQAHRKG